MASKFWVCFKARWRILVDIYGRWRFVVILITTYGIVGFIRGEFLPNLPIIRDITPLLPAWAWVLIIMGVLLVLTIEGAYRLVRKAKDNYIDNYRYENGRLPPLPKELEELFLKYQAGEPISKK